MTLSELLRQCYDSKSFKDPSVYRSIPGFRLLAACTNATSGIAKYKGREVYFHLDYKTDKFIVEPA